MFFFFNYCVYANHIVYISDVLDLTAQSLRIFIVGILIRLIKSKEDILLVIYSLLHIIRSVEKTEA